MKKRYIVVIVILILIVIVGFNIYRGNRKLIVTKAIFINNEKLYEDKNIIQFKNNVATQIETIMTFDTEEAANSVYPTLEALTKDKQHNSEMKIKKQGNVLVTNNTIKSYVNYKGNFTKNFTRDEIEAWFKEQGYTIISK